MEKFYEICLDKYNNIYKFTCVNGECEFIINGICIYTGDIGRDKFIYLLLSDMRECAEDNNALYEFLEKIMVIVLKYKDYYDMVYRLINNFYTSNKNKQKKPDKFNLMDALIANDYIVYTYFYRVGDRVVSILVYYDGYVVYNEFDFVYTDTNRPLVAVLSFLFNNNHILNISQNYLIDRLKDIGIKPDDAYSLAAKSSNISLQNMAVRDKIDISKIYNTVNDISTHIN